MDFQTMIADVRSVLKDEGGLFITDTDIKRWLNEAQRDLATRLGILQKEETGTVAAGSVIPFTDLDYDVVDIIWLKVAGDTTEVSWVNNDVFMSWSDSAGSPSTTIARVFSGQIELYPSRTGSAYTIRYQTGVADLAANGDVSRLPTHLHIKMVNYARAHGHYKDGSSMGDTYMMLYERGLPEPALGRKPLNPGPLTLTMQAGPFDTSDARHI